MRKNKQSRKIWVTIKHADIHIIEEEGKEGAEKVFK